MDDILPLVGPSIEVRRAADRAVTTTASARTAHSFAFGAHYDPADVGFEVLLAHNDEQLPAGGGYPEHPHRDLEIVSVVLDGVLRHESAAGRAEVGPGEVQRLSAGSGVVHAETAGEGPVRFVQTWLRPCEPGGAPSYAHAVADGDGLVPLVGGDGPLSVRAGARLWLATGPVALPDVPWLHVFVTDGRLEVGAEKLGPADAARLRHVGGIELSGSGRALVWGSARRG